MKLWAALGAMTAMSACATAGPQPASNDVGTAVVFGTVGHSEWCHAGNVRVDLETGRYALTHRAPRAVCQDAGLERPISEGRLDVAQLRALEQAFQRAVRHGLNDCRAGARPDDVIVSNGGVPVLVVTDGRGTASAPTELNCWSDAGRALHRLLDATFPPSR